MSLHGKTQPVENFRLHKAQPVPQVYCMWSGARHERLGNFAGGYCIRYAARVIHDFHCAKIGHLFSESINACVFLHMYGEMCVCVLLLLKCSGAQKPQESNNGRAIRKHI